MSHLHQPTFNHDPPNEFSSPASVGAKKMHLDTDHMLQPLLHWRVQHLMGGKEIILENAAALMVNAAAKLTYIIHEASQSEQQHMFARDACGLEVQQHCDSTPLRSDGNVSSHLGPKSLSKQVTGCIMPPGGIGATQIIYYGFVVSHRTIQLKRKRKETHGDIIGSLTVEDVLRVIGPDPVVRVVTNRRRSQGRVAGHDVKAAL